MRLTLEGFVRGALSNDNINETLFEPVGCQRLSGEWIVRDKSQRRAKRPAARYAGNGSGERERFKSATALIRAAIK